MCSVDNFGGGRSNLMCLWQDTKIPTSCSRAKYRIAIDRDCCALRNSSLLLYYIVIDWYEQYSCYRKFDKTLIVGLCMTTSNSVNRPCSALLNFYPPGYYDHLIRISEKNGKISIYQLIRIIKSPLQLEPVVLPLWWMTGCLEKHDKTK